MQRSTTFNPVRAYVRVSVALHMFLHWLYPTTCSSTGYTPPHVPPLVIPHHMFLHWLYPTTCSSTGYTPPHVPPLVIPHHMFLHWLYPTTCSSTGYTPPHVPPLVIPHHMRPPSCFLLYRLINQVNASTKFTLCNSSRADQVQRCEGDNPPHSGAHSEHSLVGSCQFFSAFTCSVTHLLENTN